MNLTYSLLCNIALDITGYAPVHELANLGIEESWPTTISIDVGGSIVNVGKAMFALGAKTNICSWIGKDRISAFISSQLRETVFTTVDLFDQAEHANRTVLLVDTKGQKKIFYERATPPDLEELKAHFVPKLSRENQLHVAPNPWTIQIAKAIKAANPQIRISTDLHTQLGESSLMEPDFLRCLDVLFFSAAGLDQEQVHLYLSMFEALRIPVVVSTMAEKGCLIRESGESISIPAPIVPEVRNSVGAGDVFAGSFLSLLYSGYSARRAGVAAVTQASYRCTQQEILPLISRDRLVEGVGDVESDK